LSSNRAKESSPQAKAIVRAVLALGKSPDIPVLAEGIETQGQLKLLAAEGCDEAQGYLLGRPGPLRQIVTSGQMTLTGKGLLQDVAVTVQAGGLTLNPPRV
jgi:EAL domain-containing protein (putative c-di-GMP-specific phosphodiesterase class I)